jgi:hypothetical protein
MHSKWVLEHTFIDIKCDCPDCYSDHALGVVEELDSLCIQGKVIRVLYMKQITNLLTRWAADVEERKHAGGFDTNIWCKFSIGALFKFTDSGW